MYSASEDWHFIRHIYVCIYTYTYTYTFHVFFLQKWSNLRKFSENIAVRRLSSKTKLENFRRSIFQIQINIEIKTYYYLQTNWYLSKQNLKWQCDASPFNPLTTALFSSSLLYSKRKIFVLIQNNFNPIHSTYVTCISMRMHMEFITTPIVYVVFHCDQARRKRREKILCEVI